MQRIDLLLEIREKLEGYRGIWPWIADQADVSFVTVHRLANGLRGKMYHDGVQKVYNVLADIAHGDLPIPEEEMRKLQSKLGKR